MQCPTCISTRRLFLRRPEPADAKEIFRRYAGDPAVGRFLAWPVHESVDDTADFLEFSAAEWARWPAGPYLVFDRQASTLIGSTGLAFERNDCAATGYVIAKAYWGRGYATEAVAAMQALASSVGLKILYALCHPDHRASQRVLEKTGFANRGVYKEAIVFPNQENPNPQSALRFDWLPRGEVEDR